MELEPDERTTRPAEESRDEILRGRASSTPFALLLGVSLAVAGVVALLVLAIVLIWVFV